MAEQTIPNLDIKDFQSISSAQKLDSILMVLSNGLGAKVTIDLLIKILLKDIQPSINEAGEWVIGTNLTGQIAVGKSPFLQTSENGIEWKYEDETSFRPLVSYDQLKLKFTDMTPEQIQMLVGGKGDTGDTGDVGPTGETGKSTYAIAAENGYVGTEQQFGEEQAAIAGNSARLTSVENNKANLINGTISPDEISSLQGRQTGVHLYGNSYYSQQITDANLGHNSFSVEFYFNYDTIITMAGQVYNMVSISDENNRSVCAIYRQSTGVISMYLNNRSESGVYEQIGFNVSSNGNNHIVLTVDRVNKLFTCYINGKAHREMVFQTPISYTTVNKIIIGDDRPNNQAQPFIAKHFRIFNYILSVGDVNKLYGFGNPELFSIDYKLNMNATNRCIHEYLPTGILLTKWRASIGGVDLPALGLSENRILDYKKNLMSSLAPLFIARGAVLNNSTGFYELNGLTDITSNEMELIYAYSNSFIPIPYNLRSSTIRTNFRSAGAYWLCDLTNTFASSSLAVINFMGGYYVNNFTNAFNNCRLLKSIIGDLVCFDGTTVLHSIFNGDILLESFSLSNLYRSISIADSPLLNRETIMYMIDKSKNTTPIIITLHPTAKARLTEEDIALAVSKNITIA